jgi:hypothetical protein
MRLLKIADLELWNYELHRYQNFKNNHKKRLLAELDGRQAD